MKRTHCLIISIICFVIAALVLYAGIALAAPKMTADCSLAADNVTGAMLQLDDGAWNAIPVVQTCVGQTETVNCTAPAVTVCQDTTTLSNGSHVAKLRWTNLWGPSNDSAPLSFVKALPSTSPLLRLK